MAQIRGFRAARFTAEAGPLSRLIAPPSGLVSPESRAHLAIEPNNSVHATIPPSDPDDRSKFVRYARASAQLAGWRRAGLLRTDERPAYYRLTSSTFGADEATLLALVPIAAIGEAEAALVREREDRLRMLEATRTYLEPVPLSIEGSAPHGLLARASATETWTATTESGETFTLDAFPFPDPGDSSAEELGAFRPFAGGSAAVEAARAFRAAKGEKPGPIAEDYLLAAIGPRADSTPAGLVFWSLGEFA